MKKILFSLGQILGIIILTLLLSALPTTEQKKYIALLIVISILIIIITIKNISNFYKNKLSSYNFLEITNGIYISIISSFIYSMYKSSYAFEFIFYTAIFIFLSWIINNVILLYKIKDKKFIVKYCILIFIIFGLYIITEIIQIKKLLVFPIMNEYVLYKSFVFTLIYICTFKLIKNDIIKNNF